MDIALSAMASELVSRFMSFLIHKYRNQACQMKTKKKVEMLLVRVHAVVEEAETRYITNSMMLVQLKMLTEAMYRGDDALDTYGHLKEAQQVSGSTVNKLLRMTKETIAAASHDHVVVVESALEHLQTTVANMAEFVTLLMGCERMSRSPYSSYLYMDNFMFGHRVERQEAINILMQDNPCRAPTVLPIIGGHRVGKKTLVWSVCADEKISSRFSSILHINGNDVQKIDFLPTRTLVVVDFQSSDVDDKEWSEFYSSLATLIGTGSKVVIITRLEKLARFGTVKPIRINSFSREEYSYLFKVLAFGSSNPADHPRLALIGKELASMMEGSLVHLNVYASVLRNNLNVQVWTCVLELYKMVMEANLSLFGERPRSLLDKGSIVDITKFSLSSSSARIMLLVGERERDSKLPKMTFRDIIAGSVILPTKFQMVWESRLPPYTVISATCAAETPQSTTRRKRQRLSMSL